jgi:hypothetical protein
MKAGIGVGDLLPLIKLAYVRAARDEARASGRDLRRPNASRISVVTGLPRREVANILASESVEPVGHERDRAQRADRVLSGWWNDPDFQDRLGEPAALPLRGAKRSFAALVERYSGERWRVATMLEELLWVKAIRRLPDGRLKALSRSYATVRWNPQGVTAFGEQLAEYCATLLHNLEHPSDSRFVYRALNARVNPEYLPILLRDVREQADSFARRWEDLTIASLRFHGLLKNRTEVEQMSKQADPMALARNLWGYADIHEAARACQLAIEADYHGH